MKKTTVIFSLDTKPAQEAIDIINQSGLGTEFIYPFFEYHDDIPAAMLRLVKTFGEKTKTEDGVETINFKLQPTSRCHALLNCIAALNLPQAGDQ